MLYHENTIRNMLIVDEGDPFNELNTGSINKIKSSNLFSKENRDYRKW